MARLAPHSIGPPSLGPDSGPRYSPGPRLGVKTGIPSLGIANPEPRDAYLGPESGPRFRVGPEARGSLCTAMRGRDLPGLDSADPLFPDFAESGAVNRKAKARVGRVFW